MKLWYHKLSHWEYWPVYIVYIPTFFLWIWYMIKFRSLKFYKFSNPNIKNGGFYGDSKKDIYELLPKNTYPKTIIVRKGVPSELKNIILQNQIDFPIIVKPDIGCRGVGLQKLYHLDELKSYDTYCKKDYLIQELINLPNEIGLFYYRMPNESSGKITGLTLKKFLTVEGNGQETIEQLMKKNPRSEMQITKNKSKMNLDQILPQGEKICLVPFGNHNLGTEFLDGKEMITQKLEQTFDGILSKVEGFFYGRLDIRYNTFEELEEGINFSIIELNGAKSEPTHIYDPKHSFLYGQKEIIRHQKIFQRIIKLNVQQLTACYD